MKRRIRIAGATFVVAAGLIAAVAAPVSGATNPPQLKASMGLCTAQKGTYFSPGFGGYTCTKTTGFSADQVQTARRICKRVFGLAFPGGVIFTPGTNTATTVYACFSD